MNDPFRITAVGAVTAIKNCTVRLLIDGGNEVGGRWQSGEVEINKSIGARKQRAKASEIARFEKGGERLEGWSRVYLESAPAQKPDWVEVNGDKYKVFDVDFRPESDYWRITMARLL
ncbi:hypothetical protein PQE20_27460 (plasmid) [Vibrio harveyi]|uniref:hypothetical protein n=1 Tax=Vibrio harveyi TaxID=669 RepID=UPI00234CB0E9|nr:hypothetical protein [Vibrio harveyi]WCP84219.1 hypothetical protein PQE20_27460 [Vibrio harveyi]